MGLGKFVEGISTLHPRRLEKLHQKVTGGLGKLDTPESREHIGYVNGARNEWKQTEALHNASPSDATREAVQKAKGNYHDTLKAGKSHLSDAKSFARGQMVNRVVTSKWFLVPAVAAATVGAISWMAGKRAEKARESRDELRNQRIESARAEMAAMQSQVGANTMMGMEPQPGQHAQRVIAARNGGMGIDTSNPPVNMQYEAVR